jgi:hypothetical protein
MGAIQLKCRLDKCTSGVYRLGNIDVTFGGLELSGAGNASKPVTGRHGIENDRVSSVSEPRHSLVDLPPLILLSKILDIRCQRPKFTRSTNLSSAAESKRLRPARMASKNKRMGNKKSLIVVRPLKRLAFR